MKLIIDDEEPIIDDPWGKSVVYFGITLLVPDETRFLATDKSGNIWAYEEEPSPLSTYSFWHDGKHIETVAKVNLEGMDWKDTLTEVE